MVNSLQGIEWIHCIPNPAALSVISRLPEPGPRRGSICRQEQVFAVEHFSERQINTLRGEMASGAHMRDTCVDKYSIHREMPRNGSSWMSTSPGSCVTGDSAPLFVSMQPLSLF